DMNYLKKMMIGIFILVCGVIVAGQVGMFQGQRPFDLGVQNGKLKACPTTPNCISSFETPGSQSFLPAWEMKTDLATEKNQLKQVISNLTEAKLMNESETELSYEFSTSLMKYVDDVEFYFDDASKKIHFRSASRLGKSDLGKNRQRILEIEFQRSQTSF
ncbi:MAG: DUF1499 domain-containing protein, partial [Pseudobdellovibrionaceae bacterium]